MGVVGDLCRALGTKILPYGDELMVLLLENLSVSSSLHLHECVLIHVHVCKYMYMYIVAFKSDPKLPVTTKC